MKRRWLAAILAVMMVFYAMTTFAALPSEVTSKSEYVPIPVYFQGNKTGLVTKEISKTVNGVEIKGKAVFYMRAFAYKTGEQIKIGTQINFIGSDGTLKQEWWDQNITADIETVNWPQCTNVIVEVSDDFDFVSKTQNIDETRVKLSMTVLGNTFSRETENIKLDANFGGIDVTLKAYNADHTLLDTFVSSFVGDESVSEKIFSNPIIVDPGAKVTVNVKGEFLKKQEYTILKADDGNTPKLPLNSVTWNDLGELEKVEPNMWESYPDLLKEKQGYLSTKHYNYKYGEVTSTDTIPPRKDTFCYPIGEDNVFQLAKPDSGNQYHSVAESAAFFSKSYTGKTTMAATFSPKGDKDYQFAVYCNDDKKDEYVPTVTVKDNSTGVMTTLVAGKGGGSAYYHGYEGHEPYCVSYNFKAGKTYTFNATWQQKGGTPVPTLYYREASNNDPQQGWTLVPAGFFSDEKYVGGANKAVKFWGYLVPSGDDFTDGMYHLGSYADDGVYGYIIMEDKKVEFAENWDLSEATNRSGVNGTMVDLQLKKDTVYPIYMEWYEGKPTEKSFIPRYKEVGSSTWKDIPQDWFYASADSTPGQVNVAYFDSYVADSEIKLPEEPGTYYVAVKVTTDFGEEKQVLQGPFKIEKFEPTLPDIMEDSDNYIIPYSISNVFFKTDYMDYAKGIVYTVDLDNLIDKTVTYGGTALSVFDLKDLRATATIKQTGGVTLSAGDYTTEIISVDGKKKIKITLQEEWTVMPGDSQDVKVYFECKMGSDMRANIYKEQIIGQTDMYTVSVEAYPGYEKQLTDSTTGVVTNEIVYLGDKVTVSSTDIEGVYKDIPTIH